MESSDENNDNPSGNAVPGKAERAVWGKGREEVSEGIDMLFKEERNYGYKISNPESIPS